MQDVSNYETRVKWFSLLFHINFESPVAEFQISIIDAQCDTELRNTHRHGVLLDFQTLVYLLLSFPVLYNRAKDNISFHK
jgi:hypothetical protein